MEHRVHGHMKSLLLLAATGFLHVLIFKHGKESHVIVLFQLLVEATIKITYV